MTDSKEDGLTISVEREDLEDGSITYHLWDTTNGDYKWIVGLNDDKLAQGGKSKFYAERIAMAVNALSASSPPVGGSGEVVAPEFNGIAKVKLDGLLRDGWRISGYSIMKGEDRHGFVTTGAFVGWWLPEYYPNHTSSDHPPVPVPNGVPEGGFAVHPRWKTDTKSDRHPQTLEEWDWHQDGPDNDARERSVRRLTVSSDYDDPRAPDQMTLVNRIDLIRVLGDYVFQRARVQCFLDERRTATDEAWQELIEKDDRTSPPEYPDMALITKDELWGFIIKNAPTAVAPVTPEGLSGGEDA